MSLNIFRLEFWCSTGSPPDGATPLCAVIDNGSMRRRWRQSAALLAASGRQRSGQLAPGDVRMAGDDGCVHQQRFVFERRERRSDGAAGGGNGDPDRSHTSVSPGCVFTPTALRARRTVRRCRNGSARRADAARQRCQRGDGGAAKQMIAPIARTNQRHSRRRTPGAMMVQHQNPDLVRASPGVWSAVNRDECRLKMWSLLLDQGGWLGGPLSDAPFSESGSRPSQRHRTRGRHRPAPLLRPGPSYYDNLGDQSQQPHLVVDDSATTRASTTSTTPSSLCRGMAASIRKSALRDWNYAAVMFSGAVSSIHQPRPGAEASGS